MTISSLTDSLILLPSTNSNDIMEQMKIFLLGGTGKTGYEVLKQLVDRKYSITALVRNPLGFNLDGIEEAKRQQVTIVKGSALDKDTLEDKMGKCDLVISILGTGTKNEYTEIYSEGGRNILEAMRIKGVKKLITITSGLIDMSDPSTDNFFLNRIIRPNFNKIYYDQTRWETILDDTKDIEWMCVRPTYLTNGDPTGDYRVKERHCPIGGRKIRRSDLADFIIKQISPEPFIYKKPVLAY